MRVHPCLSPPHQPVIYYLVKWCSLPYEDSTWELKEDVDEGKVCEFKRIQARHPELKRVVSGLSPLSPVSWCPQSLHNGEECAGGGMLRRVTVGLPW